MTWDVHARRTHEHGSHVRVTWREIGTVYDVSIDCPAHVHGSSSTGLVRREMNTFTKAIDADIQWDEDVESPCVILSWADAGVQCEQTLRLDEDIPSGRESSAEPRSSSLHDGLRRVLSKAPRVPVRFHGRSGQHADR
jgi:hypothetical protein